MTHKWKYTAPGSDFMFEERAWSAQIIVIYFVGQEGSRWRNSFDVQFRIPPQLFTYLLVLLGNL